MIINNNQTEFLDKLTSVVPSPRQLAWQEMEYYNFIHYGTNTYLGKEWGDGSAEPSCFAPTALDTDQWVQALIASGSKGVILTAKHHDGFCLFPSKFTDYTIAQSPYKGGKGDIVKELSLSCKKYNFKLGLYLSPWDRHEKTYGSDAYNDFFCNQLTELLTNYGELFALWFDGACGEGVNGKKQIYDFPRYYQLIRKYQPNAVITVCGPDVRWIGNEGGVSRDSEFSVQNDRLRAAEFTASLSQQDDADNMQKPISSEDRNLGSRENLVNAKALCWYPAEMDVSITKKGWFWSKSKEFFYTRSVENLLNLYYSSVGHNACLLLNIPVNKEGLISKKFANRLSGMGKTIKDTLTNPIQALILPVMQEGSNYVYDISTPFATCSTIVLQEDITFSQRVESYKIQYSTVEGVWVTLYKGTTIGYKQICRFRPVNCQKYRLVITSCRKNPYMKEIQFFR